MRINLPGTGKNFPALLSLIFFFSLFPLFSQDSPDLWSDELDESIEDFYLLEEEKGLTIVGTLKTSQQMAIIEKDDIERRSAADLATLLQEALNLNITRYGVYGNMALLNLRGLDLKRLAFLIDGMPVNSSIDGKFDIEQIDLNSIERIEVIYGGSDTKYNVSGAMGGVINIITVKKQKTGLRLGASVSNTSVMPGEYLDRNDKKQDPHFEDLLDTQNITLSAVYGGNDFSIKANAFANRAQNHFNFIDQFNRTRRKDNNEVWDAGGSASLTWELSDLTKLIASANFYYGDKNIPRTSFSSLFGKQQDIFSRNNIILDMPRAFHDDLAAEASFGWHFIRKDYTTPADVLSRHDQQDIMFINRWSWYPGEKLILRSGFDYHFSFLDSTEIGNRNRHDGGIYLTAEYKPVKRFLVITSAKAVFTNGGSSTFTAIPKLGLLWNVTDSIDLKNNYFRSFKFPDFEELYWSGDGGIGNPDLHPEDGWGGDLGLSWRFRDLFTLDSTFYTHWLKDSIHWYSIGGGLFQPENVGESIFFGLENKLNFGIPIKRGPIKKIIPSISYQYLLSYLLSFGYDYSSGKRIPYSPLHTIGASLEILWETGSVLFSGHYESMRYDDRANLAKLKPHFLLNAAVNQKVGKNFSVSGVLRNILNESYESFVNYPMPGISLTAGLRAEFEVKGGSKNE